MVEIQEPDIFYINSQDTISSITANRPVSIHEQRQGNILTNSQNYLLSLDRWTLKCRIPLFVASKEVKSSDNKSIYKMSFVKKSDGTTYTRQVVLTKSLYYSLKSLANDLNSTLNDLCGDASLASDLLVMSYNGGDKTFSISADASFTSSWTLSFNFPLFAIFETFEYDDEGKDITSDTYINLVDGDNKQSASTLDQFPTMEYIQIISPSLPILPEFTPSYKSTSSTEIQSENILSDFKIDNTTGTSFIKINFSSGGNHRWQQFYRSSFNSYSIVPYFRDTFGNLYEIPFTFGQGLNIKALFKSKKLIT